MNRWSTASKLHEPERNTIEDIAWREMLAHADEANTVARSTYPYDHPVRTAASDFVAALHAARRS